MEWFLMFAIAFWFAGDVLDNIRMKNRIESLERDMEDVHPRPGMGRR